MLVKVCLQQEEKVNYIFIHWEIVKKLLHIDLLNSTQTLKGMIDHLIEETLSQHKACCLPSVYLHLNQQENGK